MGNAPNRMAQPSKQRRAGARSSGEVHFNGIDVTTGDYWRSPMEADRLGAAAKRAEPVEQGMSLVQNPDDLSDTGWGVVFAPGVGEDVKEALEPLLELRRQQATRREKVRYREMEARRGEGVAQFLKRLGADGQWADPQRVPACLLLVGGPEEIPFAFQTGFNLGYVAGRIAFDKPEEYAAYAKAVVDSETAPCLRPRRVALCGADCGGDPIVGVAIRKRVEAVEMTVVQASPDWDAITLTQGLGTRERFAGLLGGDGENPAVLLGAAHGACMDVGVEGREEQLGSLVCCDWPGPEEWKKALKPGHLFGAKDLDDASVRGMIVMLEGSFTAGWPRRPILGELLDGDSQQSSQGEHPFIAALPRRLLTHPAGPALAVLGHCDICCLNLVRRQREGLARFLAESLDALMHRQMLASVLQEYRRCCLRLATELEMESSEEDRRAAQIECWALRHQALSWILLGDPAIRLPAAR